ncbi:hypothetical protein COO60DRAFT_1524685 [Scenedesmus sp. NREL 46B-D3]|nr:hypothetical protein COO60DRAFT_1524685 [Scenedesmus sp. NREL 46B-D3]
MSVCLCVSPRVYSLSLPVSLRFHPCVSVCVGLCLYVSPRISLCLLPVSSLSLSVSLRLVLFVSVCLPVSPHVSSLSLPVSLRFPPCVSVCVCFFCFVFLCVPCGGSLCMCGGAQPVGPGQHVAPPDHHTLTVCTAGFAAPATLASCRGSSCCYQALLMHCY